MSASLPQQILLGPQEVFFVVVSASVAQCSFFRLKLCLLKDRRLSCLIMDFSCSVSEVASIV